MEDKDKDIEKGLLVGVEHPLKQSLDFHGGSTKQLLPKQFIEPLYPANASEMIRVTELIFAASSGNVAEMMSIINTGLDPNTGDYDHRTALHVAACEGQVDAVKKLIEAGARANVADRWHETPLDGAAKNGQKEIAAILLEASGEYGPGHSTSLTLIQAVDDNDFDTIRHILDIGFSPNVCDYDNRTPLHIAVANKNLDIAKLLLDNGADVHAHDRFGKSPMAEAQAAAPRFGPDPMRDLLLAKGGRVFKDVSDDNKLEIDFFLVLIEVVFFILYGFFVRYGDGASGMNAVASATEVTSKYSQFQDVHVMIFIGFGLLMVFLKKYAYSAFTYTLMLSVIAIQWHILVGGFFEKAFHGEWSKIQLSLSTFILSDFAAAAVLISFGAILGKVTKPSQLIVIALLEIVFYAINEEIGKLLHVSDIGGSMVIHAFGAYFGLGVSYVLTVAEARSHTDNSANYVSDVFSMVGSIFLWMFWPSFNSALASAYDQERAVINTLLSLTASAVASFAASYYLRGVKKFDMVDIQNASIAGGVAIGTTSNMMLGPVGAQVIGFLAGWLSVSGYVIIQPFLEKKLNIYDTCGVHNLHGMPGVLGGLASIVVAGIASVSDYNGIANYSAVFYNQDAGKQAGAQAAFLFITLGIASVTGVCTGLFSKIVCGGLQPRLYNDDQFFEKAFR